MASEVVSASARQRERREEEDSSRAIGGKSGGGSVGDKIDPMFLRDCLPKPLEQGKKPYRFNVAPSSCSSRCSRSTTLLFFKERTCSASSRWCLFVFLWHIQPIPVSKYYFIVASTPEPFFLPPSLGSLCQSKDPQNMSAIKIPQPLLHVPIFTSQSPPLRQSPLGPLANQ